MLKTLEQINTAGIKFLSPLTPKETYETIASEIKRLVPVSKYVTIYLEKSDELERVFTTEEKFYQIKIKKNEYTYRCYFKHKTYNIQKNEIRNINPILKKLDINSTVFIPLSYKYKAIGVLSIDTIDNDTFTEKDLEVLKLFSSMATMAIRKTELYVETKKALEMRDLFISLASHELRTPLTSINGYIQLLYSKFSKSNTNEGKWIKELYSESMRLTNLVMELLEINRIKQGQLNYNFIECNLIKVIEDTIERANFIKESRKILFETKIKSKNVIIIGDYDKLLQMFYAILNNAMKFSHLNTTIRIILTKQKTNVVLIVKDEGEGIRKEEMTRIFEEFYKGSNSLRNQKEGLGVGLLLAKHIAASHKGEIYIKSKEGEGTEVQIKLPIAKI